MERDVVRCVLGRSPEEADMVCRYCSEELNQALYLDAGGNSVSDQLRAKWKACPRCSELEPSGRHVYLALAAFGTTEKREGQPNPTGIHSWCVFHRNKKHKNERNPDRERILCGGAAARTRPAARAPVIRRSSVTAPVLDDDVVLTPEQLDALAAAQVGWLKLSEEGRKFLRTHVDTERKPGNRQAIIRLRRANGALTCDGCDVDLAEEYGEEHQTVLELHHIRPLARGIQKPKGTEDFALLCPTCHRVVHYRREEPLRIDELRHLLSSAA